jgi:small neutral amino acid transporter SnatA (MarC family)
VNSPLGGVLFILDEAPTQAGDRVRKWLSPIVLRLITRIRGLLLVAIAIQFALGALEDLKGKLL